jgi:hypothetical protein
MMRPNDPWAAWRTVEPEVEPGPGVAARWRAVRRIRRARPDLPVRRWWQV